MTKPYLLFRLLSLLLAVTLLLAPFSTRMTHAQSSDETAWTEPVNLSNSGLTTLPGLISDQNGIVHVVWNDNTLGAMHSQLVDGAWSQPAAIKVPFSENAPVFVDGGNYIHAFWIDRTGDTLYHSRVVAANFGAGSWERAKVLARGVKDFKAVYQPDNSLHLVYLASLEDSRNQAGVYYLRSTDAGVRFETAKAIYTSRYYRSVDPALANVDISVTLQDGTPAVYVVWNNPALKRVFLSTSLDGGETWAAPTEVDGPSEANATSSPYNPIVTASGSDVLMVWQANLQSGFACSQYYQYSRDGGASWSERTRMLTEFVGCAQENTLLKAGEGLSLLQTIFQDEVYLVAWNGEMWSKAYRQNSLASFNDPLTNEAVVFRCRQSNIRLGETLFMVGCNDQGNEDVWITSRAIGPPESWFPSSTLWDDPVLVVESENAISSVQTVADDRGVYHTLWLQEDKTEQNVLHRAIHYVRFADNSLSQPSRILVSPDRVVEAFTVALDHSRNRLVVVWVTGTTGEIYYSWADISRATSTFEWSKAVALPVQLPLAKSPDVLITPDGTIYVAYAIPVNEERGIYMVSSLDGGVTWEQPAPLYVVTEPDWQVIDYPKIASSGNEILHLIWRRDRIFGDASAVGLYYARSTDRGQTWSAPQVVSNDLVHGAWQVESATNGLHRFWLTLLGQDSSFYHDASMDQGANWRLQDNLTGFGETPGLASPFIDSAGRVNFVQAVENSNGNLVINHQRDNDGRWSIEDSLPLGAASIDQVTSISAQELVSGRLILAYTFSQDQPEQDQLPFSLYLAAQNQQSVQSTATAAARRATPTPVSTPLTTMEPSQPAETSVPTESLAPPTPLPLLSTSAPTGPGVSIDVATGLVISGGLALLVVAVFFLYSRLRRP